MDTNKKDCSPPPPLPYSYPSTSSRILPVVHPIPRSKVAPEHTGPRTPSPTIFPKPTRKESDLIHDVMTDFAIRLEWKLPLISGDEDGRIRTGLVDGYARMIRETRARQNKEERERVEQWMNSGDEEVFNLELEEEDEDKAADQPGTSNDGEEKKNKGANKKP